MGKRRARRQRGRAASRHRVAARPALARDASTSSPGPAAVERHAQLERQLHRQSLSWDAIFGRTFWVLAAVAAVAGIACYHFKGAQVFRDSLVGDVDLLLFIAPRFGAGMLIAAFVAVLLSREQVARYIGESAGLKAVGIATAAGGLTPGGPMTAFPIVVSLRDAGTGRSPLIAYVTSWSTMGFQRILNWELPLLGPEFTLLRLAASLPLPIIAGLTSRLLPIPPEPSPNSSPGTATDAR